MLLGASVLLRPGASRGSQDLPGPDYAAMLSALLDGSIDVPVDEDSVTAVGQYAFAYCGSLPYVRLANAVTVGPFAFMESLAPGAAVELPSAETTGQQAFRNSRVGTLSVPSLRTFGDHCMMGSTRLASISAPLVSSLPVNVFNGCQSLASAHFPSCTYVGQNAFITCKSLATVVLGTLTGALSNAFACSASAVVSVGNTMAGLASLSGYPWGAPHGLRFSCSDGEVVV